MSDALTDETSVSADVGPKAAAHTMEPIPASPWREKRDVEAAKEEETPNESPEDKPSKPAVDLTDGQARLAMMAVILSLTVVFLDGFIPSPALPVIATELSANDASYAWIASGLLLTMAVSVPIQGKASDVFGRRNMMIFANVVFLLGAFIGGFARSVATLIAARLIQGIGCGGLAVVANICVVDLFGPRNRGVYFGMIGTISAIASAAGPVIGGALASKASWRWCFWMNIPITAVSFVLQVIFLKWPRPSTPWKEGLIQIDWLGAFTLLGSTSMLLVGLQLGGTQSPWNSAPVLCLIVFGLVLFIAFVSVERSFAKRPLVPLSMFASVSRTGTTIVMIAQSMISSGVKYFLVLHFQLAFGVSPLESAVYYLPYAVGLAFILPAIGWSIKKTGRYRFLIRSGACVLTVGAGLMIDAEPERDWPLIIVPQVLLAIGVGLTYQSSTIAFQAQIKQDQGTAGQSAFQLLRNFFQMVGVVLGQIIFQSQVSHRIRRLNSANLDGGFAAELASGNTFEALSLLQGLSPHQVSVIRGLLAASFQDMWILFAAIGLFGFVVSFGIVDVNMV